MIAKLSHLGSFVREARKSSSLTQAQLAEKARVSLSALQGIEKGRGRVTTLKRLLRTLRIELRGRRLTAGPIGRALVAARKNQRISKRNLATVLGVSRNTLSATEAGGGLLGTLEAYAEAVGAELAPEIWTGR